MDDASAHHIVRIWVDAVEQLHAKSRKFIFGAGQVKGNLSFEYFLGALLLTANERKDKKKV